jgi:type I restriction enzyme S subunit
VALVDEDLSLVTVKRSRWCEQRETCAASQKHPSFMSAGDFLISKRQIVQGLRHCSPNWMVLWFLTSTPCSTTTGSLICDFALSVQSRYFQRICFHSSIGMHVERYFQDRALAELAVNIPPLPVQRHRPVRDTARREVELIAAQIGRLKQEKAALMADLPTGKRRVRLPAAEGKP